MTRTAEGLRVVDEGASAAAEVVRLQEALDSHNIAVTGRPDWWPLAVLLRDRDGIAVGGVAGDAWAGWLHVKLLWVDEAYRRHGWGSRLLREAERLASERGCRAVHLETFSFQAPGFYLRQGYEVFGQLHGYPDGYTHFYLKKALA